MQFQVSSVDETPSTHGNLVHVQKDSLWTSSWSTLDLLLAECAKPAATEALRTISRFSVPLSTITAFFVHAVIS